MRYSNAPQLEGVNAREGEGEGREFLLLGAAFVVCALFASFLFLRVGAVIGPLIPFSWEQRLAPDTVLKALGDGDVKTQARLQALAGDIVAVMDMPDGITITLHYSNQETKNAFATFGGNIVMFRGLLDDLGSEDAVAALLAHEIAHVKHRHVIKGATGGVLLSVLWASIGFSGDTAGQIGSLGSLSQLPMLSGTRAMERQADREAADVLVALYGHAGGYFALFDALGELSGKDALPNVLRSHPKVDDRVAAAKRLVPLGQQSGALTPWGTAAP